MSGAVIAIVVVAAVGAVVVLGFLTRVMRAAMELQRAATALSERVSAQLRELGTDVDTLGDSIDKTRRQ